jgi:hypothetical protein
MHTQYVALLPEATQRAITTLLIEAGISGKDLERALDSRLCDLVDTIDVSDI